MSDNKFDKNWACPRCGNRSGVIIKYDKDNKPVGRSCPRCGLGGRSK